MKQYRNEFQRALGLEEQKATAPLTLKEIREKIVERKMKLEEDAQEARQQALTFKKQGDNNSAIRELKKIKMY